ncbi:MAG: hypothetical protein AAB403_04175 [Planctomycetota bacterium]
MHKILLAPSVIVIWTGALLAILNAVLDRNLAKARKILAVGAAVTTIVGGILAWNSEQTAMQRQERRFSDLNRQFATFIQVATQWPYHQRDEEILTRLTTLEDSLTRLRNSPVRSLASKLAKELAAFADERDRATPGLFGTSAFGETMPGGHTPEQLVSYNQKTVQLYHERFTADLATILGYLTVDGKVDRNLAALATNPGGTPGIRHLAQFLAAIATKQ